MIKIIRSGLMFLACSFAWFGIVPVVHASTIIDSISLPAGETVWDKSGNPYLLSGGIELGDGSVLKIGPGTIVKANPELPDSVPYIYGIGGVLDIQGIKDDRVSISDLWSISVNYGTSTISYVDFDLTGGLVFSASTSTIDHAKIEHSIQGIDSQGGYLSITNSRIENNQNGILIGPAPGVFQARVDGQEFGTGGIGNALEDLSANSSLSSFVNITNSAVVNNSDNDVTNTDASTTVKAINNWWGRKEGPDVASGKIIGLVTYVPWLDHDPDLVPEATCCSSILFIPGLQGTRLYKQSVGILGISTSTTKLWEPWNNAGVKSLYLNKNGSSTDSSIYSGQPIDKAYGLVGVYGKFMNFLDTLSDTGIVNEWKSFGYDWRKPISEVVAGDERKATTTESLINVVNDLAKNSKTGKVTLVAHSNGGLVAKYLLKTLSDLGQNKIVDKVISVAVPYLGTPEAIPALLHGSGQSLGGGILVNSATARGLGKNMSSAYSLLPSREYFKHILTPTIAFASTTQSSLNKDAYPAVIDSFSAQSDFITDSKNVRTAPGFTDLSYPIKGNALLANLADAIHSITDYFSWPSSVKSWSIVGWNQATTKGLSYGNKVVCSFLIFLQDCDTVLTHTSTTTAMGDGTVVAPSAGFGAGDIISADLKQISRDEGKNFSHMNILESNTIQGEIKKIVTSDSVSNSNLNSRGISLGEPDYSREPTFIVVKADPAVDLHIYDSNGKHVGLVASPAEVEDDVVTVYEDDIIGSSYRNDDMGTTITIPADSVGKYSVIAEGNSLSSFSLSVEKVQGGTVIDSVEYQNISVTPLTVASTSLIIQAVDVIATTTDEVGATLASSTSSVKVDADGNGSIDLNVIAGVTPDPIAQLETFKTSIKALVGSGVRGTELARRIDLVKEMFKKGKYKVNPNKNADVNRRFGHKHLQSISTKDNDDLIRSLDRFIGQFE